MRFSNHKNKTAFFLFLFTLPLHAKSLINEHDIQTLLLQEKKHPIQKIIPQGRDIIVVIDPGHGGMDPGARGFGGTYEKKVVLQIAKVLQRKLNNLPGIHAVLTRNGDYFLPLRTRLHLARQAKGDFFIAIHADAYFLPHARGASVFALSLHGASSEAARWLSEKENYSELGGIVIKNKSRDIRAILLDLAQTSTINQSIQASQQILQSLAGITELHRDHTEMAPFMVLKSPDIPSLLVETGFITNPHEEERLGSWWYQERLAKALAYGLNNYFWHYPPPNTQMAWLKKQRVAYAAH